MDNCPAPSFTQLMRLSDDTGLLEHARGASPRREHGYCVDDVARGLVVLCREPAAEPALVELAGRYLAFLTHAQADDGAFHNRFGYDRRWLDEPETMDWWGRALWAVGTAAARGPTRWLRDEAWRCFAQGVHRRSRWPRAMALAALGAAEILAVQPGHEMARGLLSDAATAIGPAGTAGSPGSAAGWPWPEPRLEYANPALAEVLIAAGQHLDRPESTADGLRLLAWLLEVQTRDGHLSVVPVGGWGPGEPRSRFDQQPIEVAALADACARALTVTGESRWVGGLRLCVDWFLGDNDSKTEMFDPETGGGFDGLTPTGRNENQGAESTLALLSTLQHARHLAPSG
jgi:hypothetical protein